MILHTVNKSPTQHKAFWDCLAIANQGDKILLLEDGVYCALTSQPCTEAIEKAKKFNIEFYALQAHLETRGVEKHINTSINAIDYLDFVALCTQHTAIQSWY